MEMTEQEYADQHAWWQIDHDKVMEEMQKEQELTKKYPYRIEVPMDNNNQWFVRWKWCGEHFACETYCWDGGYMKFKREEDAVFFALKWSGHD